MIEELYVIVDDQRHKLDLNTPSGITLNYVSTLFGDLSKVDASYSYTFKLPATRNNRQVLEMADDIRTDSSFARRKVPAEYYRNGVMLFREANLYVIRFAEDTFECVFTWNVVSGLQELYKHDISIIDLSNDLEEGEYDYYFDGDSHQEDEKDILVYIGQFTNAESVDDDTRIVNTAHNAGMMVFSPSGGVYYDRARYNSLVRPDFIRYNTKTGKIEMYETGAFYACPPPVVMASYILTMIEKHYGLTFDFRNDELFKTLCVPLIKKAQSEPLISQNYVYLPNVAWYADSKLFFKDVEVHNRCKRNEITVSFEKDYDFGDAHSVFVIPPQHAMNFDGLDNDKLYIGGSLEFGAVFESYEDTPVLIVEQLVNGEAYEVGRVNGRYEDRTLMVHFNFEPENNGSHFELDVTRGYKRIRFRIVGKDDNSVELRGGMRSNLRIYRGYDDYSIDMWTNVFHNLPDISCSDFLKAIFMTLGGYPVVSGNRIGLIKFSDMEHNLKSHIVSDWSAFLLSESSEGRSVDYSSESFGSDYAKTNYFLMKNEEVDDFGARKDNQYLEKWYKQNYGRMTIYSDLLDEFSVIYTSPFYGAFIRNEKCNAITGNTQDYYLTEDTITYTANEASPMLAVLTKDVPSYLYNSARPDEEATRSSDLCGIKIWQFEEEIATNPRYAFLCRVLSRPSVLTINMNIPETELLNIDYAKPVYIGKFNTFFAILNIECHDDGISKATLIKIPNNY